MDEMQDAVAVIDVAFMLQLINLKEESVWYLHLQNCSELLDIILDVVFREMQSFCLVLTQIKPNMIF